MILNYLLINTHNKGTANIKPKEKKSTIHK